MGRGRTPLEQEIFEQMVGQGVDATTADVAARDAAEYDNYFAGTERLDSARGE